MQRARRQRPGRPSQHQNQGRFIQVGPLSHSTVPRSGADVEARHTVAESRGLHCNEALRTILRSAAPLSALPPCLGMPSRSTNGAAGRSASPRSCLLPSVSGRPRHVLGAAIGRGPAGVRGALEVAVASWQRRLVGTSGAAPTTRWSTVRARRRRCVLSVSGWRPSGQAAKPATCGGRTASSAADVTPAPRPLIGRLDGPWSAPGPGRINARLGWALEISSRPRRRPQLHDGTPFFFLCRAGPKYSYSVRPYSARLTRDGEMAGGFPSTGYEVPRKDVRSRRRTNGLVHIVPSLKRSLRRLHLWRRDALRMRPRYPRRWLHALLHALTRRWRSPSLNAGMDRAGPYDAVDPRGRFKLPLAICSLCNQSQRQSRIHVKSCSDGNHD